MLLPSGMTTPYGSAERHSGLFSMLVALLSHREKQKHVDDISRIEEVTIYQGNEG